jgi:hypothetical protein
MMSFMEPDATGHGTRDTGQPSRPASVTHTPETQNARNTDVPLAAIDRWFTTGHGTRDAQRDTAQDAQQNTAPPTTPPTLRDGTPPQNAGHGTPAPAQNAGQDTVRDAGDTAVQDNGTSRSLFRSLSDKARNAYRERQDGVRSTADARRVMQQNIERNAQTARDAVSRDTTGRRRRAGRVVETPELAPIPEFMLKMQVWAERIGGTVLKTSPLIASGYFTYQVGTDEPLNMNKYVAIFLVLGLEGAVWYLNRLREKFKLENDSTMSISLVIFGIIGLIFTLIGGHAIWKSTGAKPILVDLPFLDSQVPIDKLVPAIAIALMSAIGAFIWAKEATYKHRAQLRAMNRIDPAAPRISAGAWVFTWWESVWSLRHAFKYRITETPTDDWRHWKAAGKPKIWPIPDGFRWDGKRLVAIPLEELREMVERDALLAALAGRNAGQQDAGQQDTLTVPSQLGTGRTTERRELPGGTPVPPVPPANGTGNGTNDGTHSGTQDGTHGTSRTGQNSGGAQNGNGTRTGHHRTDTTETNGTQNTDRTQDVSQDTGGTLTDEQRAEIIKYSSHLLAVTDAFPDWRTSLKLPAVRKINAAIDAHRKSTEGPDAKFNSLGVAGDIQTALGNLRRDPAMLDMIRDLEAKP